MASTEYAKVFGMSYKIVGVIDTKANITQYQSLQTTDPEYYTVENLRDYGYSNLIFGSEECDNKLAENMTVVLQVLSNSKKYGSCDESISMSSINTSLKDDCVKIGNSVSIYDNEGNRMSSTEVERRIAEGILTITPSHASNGGKDNVTLKVVGNTGTNSSKFSKNFVESRPKGSSSYLLSKLTGNDKTDKEFIEYCENGDGAIRFAVQNDTTSMLDNFGDFITIGAEIMLYVGIGFAVFASILLINFISTSIAYKKREIGILRALGQEVWMCLKFSSTKA